MFLKRLCISGFTLGLAFSVQAQSSVDDVKNPKQKLIIKGIVKDDVTKKGIEGATVILTGTNGTMVSKTTKKNGKYKFYKDKKTKEKLILADEEYSVKITKKGFQDFSYTESTSGIYDNEVFEDDVILQLKQ